MICMYLACTLVSELPQLISFAFLYVFANGRRSDFAKTGYLVASFMFAASAFNLDPHLFSIRQRVSVHIACGDRPLRSPQMYITMPPRSLLTKIFPFTTALYRFDRCAIRGISKILSIFFVVPTINHLPLFKPTARLWHILIFLGGVLSRHVKQKTTLCF